MAIFDDIHGRLLGRRYRIGERLGAGAFGVVFRATQEVLGTDAAPGLPFRDVALKVFAGQFVTRENAGEVFDEAVKLELLAARARTSGVQMHLVSVYDIGVFDDYLYLPYVAMELVDGGSLEGQITVGASLDHAVTLIRQVCAGISLAHANGIYHRDIKPANILFTQSGFLKVSDFGLAIDRRRAFTEFGAAGTVGYAPPDAGGIVSGAFDVYSLGIVLLEFILQQNPLVPVLQTAHRLGSPHEPALTAAQRALAQLLHPTTREPLADFHAGLRGDADMQAILRRCLAMDAADRFRDATQLETALNDWQTGKGVEVPVRTFGQVLASAHRHLNAGRLQEAAAELSVARGLAVASAQQAEFAFARARLFERTSDTNKAIASINDGFKLGGTRPPEQIEYLAGLYAKAGQAGLSRALRAEAAGKRR
jgi:serine/threonine protein kinase